MKTSIVLVLAVIVACTYSMRLNEKRRTHLRLRKRTETTAVAIWPVLKNVTEYTLFYTEYLLADVAATEYKPSFTPTEEEIKSGMMNRTLTGLPQGMKLSWYVALSDAQGRPNERNFQPIWGKAKFYKQRGKPDGTYKQEGLMPMGGVMPDPPAPPMADPAPSTAGAK